jgi:hypothetical protein
MFFDSCLSRVPDAEVVARLTKLMESGRRVTAEIVMHLAEIEERRLHLKAGHNSLFAYCIAVHRMSEDEACRRIDVARLGRRFSTVFDLLASGALSLSVAALLKDSLTAENQTSLLAAVSGKSVRAAREELAARFPVPDVPSTIRRLPGRAGVGARTLATSPPFSVPFGDVNAQRSIDLPASRTRDIAGDARPPALLASHAGSDGRASEGDGRASEGDGRASEGDGRASVGS